MLAQHPQLNLPIEDRTDSTGMASMSQRLSEMRASAVRRALIELYRIETGRLTLVGQGPGKPSLRPTGAEASSSPR
jgi:outer membrane protein OmpA-like peptidoglycan-associated protein